MLNAYRQYFERKIGNKDWDIVNSTMILKEDERECWSEKLIDKISIKELTNDIFSNSRLLYTFGISRKRKKWIDKTNDKEQYYKKSSPYISLRIRYEKTSINMISLLNFSCEEVIKYLKERIENND